MGCTANEKSNGANNDDGEAMPIYASDGLCVNPYLDVSVATAASTSRNFQFDAFTFDSNLAADTITITCDIKLGTTGDTISTSTDACVTNGSSLKQRILGQKKLNCAKI